MSELSSFVATANVPIAEPPETPKLPPREWVKANLFSSRFNSALTVVTTIILLVMSRGFLGFLFNPERQWHATATNLRLLMTHGYPEEQYLRIWVSFAVILTLTGMSMAVWRAGSAMPVTELGGKLLTTGATLTLLVFLAPFSARATVQWLIAALVVVAIGETFRRAGGEGETERTVSTLTLLVVALTGLVASLWVIPYGRHTYIADRTPKMLAEPGTVALSTKLPWTLMLIVAVAAYFAGIFLRDRLSVNPLRVTLAVFWLLAPFALVFLVLRDPAFDLGHVIGTDIPIFLAYAVLGGALLLWLTRPSTGEIGRIVAAVVLVAGFATFLTPMRMIVRFDMLMLAAFALAAPTFAGGPQARKRYTVGWLGVLGVTSWLITAVNTPSTVDVPRDFPFGGFSLTLMVAVFTILLSFPLGVALALARTSTMPIFRLLATGFIEVVRGIPLITVLFFFSVVVPLFLPDGMEITEIAAVVVGYILFSAAYLAENVRGGLQSVMRGQHEAAEAVGLTASQKTVFIVLPQALRVSIPPLVGHCIGVFKETSLMAIIGLFDILYIARNVIPNQFEFLGTTKENVLFVSLIYWIFAYQMSKASQRLERRTGLGER
ncbi:MAG: amino acid ABC transporter permease [Acidimicrobiales bacterium]|nr:amino acid ABC transporter permease [Acidimicrobiales bacterium]